MSNELIINGQTVKIIEWNGKRVITTQEMAVHHDIETRILNQKFRRNKKHFIENSDYFVVKKEMVTNCDDLLKSFYHDSGELFLFTESGYLKFVKTINDDKAWEIYNQLIDAYFLVKKLNSIEKQFLEKSKENRKGLTGEWKEHDAKNYPMLTISEYQALFGNSKIRKKDMDERELSLLSAFEFLESRKLENNPEIKGDKQLKRSLNETGKKIITIIKKKEVTND